MEPLVGEDVDLRRFPYMKLEIDRLRKSRAWLIAKRRPELAFYMINLWMASWHEVPAASLENDDDVLSDLAMCDPVHWEEVKGYVLRGWAVCDDGRIYHPVVAEFAMSVWNETKMHRDKAEKMREAKRLKNKGPPPSGNPTEPPFESSYKEPTQVVALTHKGEGELEGDKKEGKKSSPVGEPKEKLSACRWPTDAIVPDDWRAEAPMIRRQFDLPPIDPDLQASLFADYWKAQPGARGLKTNWKATWRNWIRNAKSPMNGGLNGAAKHNPHQTLFDAGVEDAYRHGSGRLLD